MSKEELQQAVQEAKQKLFEAESALEDFMSSAENNVFASLEDAEHQLENRLRNQAFEDCEGAGNCGAEEYFQEFIVDGILYEGKLSVEYDRHDKTYYYIDRARFSYEPVDRDGQ